MLNDLLLFFGGAAIGGMCGLFFGARQAGESALTTMRRALGGGGPIKTPPR